MKTYTCSICLNLNHIARLHCQTCGAVPAAYSFNGRTHNAVSGIETLAAHGCSRQEQHRGSRIGLQTVNSDYYAESK